MLCVVAMTYYACDEHIQVDYYNIFENFIQLTYCNNFQLASYSYSWQDAYMHVYTY
jgi:hypothetical protein